MRARKLVMTVLAAAAVAASGAGVAAAQDTPASSTSTMSGPTSSSTTTTTSTPSTTSTTSTPSPLIACGLLPIPVDPSHATFNYQGRAVTPIQSAQTGQWGFWYQNCFVALQ